MCVCIDACLYVYLSELLHRDSLRSGMCAPERIVAWSLSTFRHVVLCTYCMQVLVCFFALPEWCVQTCDSSLHGGFTLQRPILYIIGFHFFNFYFRLGCVA